MVFLLPIVYTLLTITYFLFPITAHAFSSVWLMDPNFLWFAFIEVPVVSCLLMGLTDTIALGFVAGQTLSGRQGMQVIAANFSAMVSNVVIIMLLIFILGGLFIDEHTHPAIIWSGMAYFAGMFAYMAWSNKLKKLSDWVKEEEKHRSARRALFTTTALSYSLLYGFLFLRLF